MILSPYIDHTLLKPESSPEQIINLCLEAKEYQFAAVCINPFYVPLAKKYLEDSNVKICTVIGFPLGANSTITKADETKWAIENGADEVDMVINIGALKSKQDEVVQKDIETVVEAADGKTVKVILETCLLTEEEKKRACELCLRAGAHFVKTSTGFSTGGATLEDVKLMKSIVKDEMQVKASGGIRDLQTALKFIEAGATRLGTSSGVAIIQGQIGSSSY